MINCLLLYNNDKQILILPSSRVQVVLVLALLQAKAVVRKAPSSQSGLLNIVSGEARKITRADAMAN